MRKFLLLIGLLLMIPAVFAGSVTRSFSTAAPCNSTSLAVTLTVDVTGESSYLINEVVPAGFVVTNSGGGDSTTTPGHIFWTILSNAQDTTYTYTVKAPAATGSATFAGTAGFAGGAESPILGQTQVTVTGCANPVDEVALRLNNLEQWKTATDSRLTVLEQWKTTAITQITWLQNQIDAMKIWLGFPSYDNVCKSVQSGCGTAQSVACSNNAACGTDAFVGANYCANNTVYRDYKAFTCASPGTALSSCSQKTTPSVVQACSSAQICQNAACVAKPVQTTKVLFRTNAVNGWVNPSTTWVAYDVDADGVLEGLGFRGSSSGCPPATWGTDYKKLAFKTPSGTGAANDIYAKTGKIGICVRGFMYEFQEGYQPGASAVLALAQTEPYKSNSQEVTG